MTLFEFPQEPASAPFLVPDFRRTDEEGREISRILSDDLIFSFWPDHATKVVIISKPLPDPIPLKIQFPISPRPKIGFWP